MGSSPVRKMWGLFALIFSAFILYHLWTIYSDYRRTIVDAQLSATNTAFTLEQHFSRALGEAEWLLVSFASTCRTGPLGPDEELALHKQLERADKALPQTSSILVVDAAGRVMAESTAFPSNHRDISDREYFRVQRDGPSGAKPWFGPPLISRGNGTPVVPFSLRVDGPGGRFCGAVIAGLDPQYFGEVFRKFIGQADGIVSVRRDDGMLMLREPLPRDRDDIGSVMPPEQAVEGVRKLSSVIDGHPRIVAFRKSERFPFTVYFGLSEQDVTNRWLKPALRNSALGAVFLLLLLLGWGHVHRLNRDIESQRERLGAALRGGSLGSWEWIFDSGRMIFDDRLQEILGYATAEAPTNLTGWRRLLHPADRRIARSAFIDHLRGRSAFYECECRLRHRDGHWVWVSIKGQVSRGTRSRPQRALGTLLDIDARKQAEQAARRSEDRYRTMVAALSEGIVLLNAEYLVLACNVAAARILGTQQSKMIGMRWPYVGWGLVDNEGHPLSNDNLPSWQALRTGKTLDSVVIGVKGANSGIAWIEVNTGPLFEDGEAAPSGVILSFADITKRRAAEAELVRSNTELEQFAYAVSHDLRQPLRMVGSYLQLLQRRLAGSLDDETREFMGFARVGAARMDSMLVALLEYSRVGRMGQPMDWLDSRAAVEEALRFLEPGIAESHAAIVIEGEWPRIFASGDEIERLFQNLIGNALKYRQPDSAPQIRLTVEAQPSEWRFTVSDNGIGIAPTQMVRLFKVFQRLHASDRYEGSGVGLALCRKIVERHGGHIWVESEGEGLGSRFIFTLPLASQPVLQAAE